ncbi:MAG TPA: glycosyltransferase family 9 protein [Verrucomicrobia bacterium]|nr:glycosyltransferase family 9 protein [Verrucomicrobiota bacterium]HOP98769.1 glycosyltransferase family 9 protein [Verrucomicrobiota bacterium]HPU55333.1 glycosyltransferase family 9 protein [Verrucomicrobiota bacterium]
MQPDCGRILVIRGGAIGDFILTLPAIAALRKQFPDVHLEVLGYPHIVQLAIAGNLVDRVRSIDARPLAGFFARNGELAPELTGYFSEFHLIVSYLFDPDKIFRTNIARCSKAQFIAGPHRPDESEELHASAAYLKPLERLAIFDADPFPRLRVQGRLTMNGPCLALHPGSGSERKNWPEANWAEFIEHLVGRTALNILLVGGEAEGDRLRRLAATIPPDRVLLAQSLPLVEVAGLLASCSGFVGHDSGISHIAGALGVPALVLWGDTAEHVWRPPQEQVRILRSPRGLAGITTNEVVREVEQMLALSRTT